MARIRVSAYGKPKKRARSFAGILGADPDTVEKCEPPAKGRRITLCMRKTGKAGPTVRGPQDVCRVMRGMRKADRESFFVLHLNVRGQIDGVDEVSKGSLSGVEVHPREVFKSAILDNTSSIIGVHNHPSGDATASREDLDLTKRLVDAGRLLGIPMRDHIIIGGGDCFSMRDRMVAAFDGARRKRRKHR